jgi:hypothetical protein
MCSVACMGHPALKRTPSDAGTPRRRSESDRDAVAVDRHAWRARNLGAAASPRPEPEPDQLEGPGRVITCHGGLKSQLTQRPLSCPPGQCQCRASWLGLGSCLRPGPPTGRLLACTVTAAQAGADSEPEGLVHSLGRHGARHWQAPGPGSPRHRDLPPPKASTAESASSSSRGNPEGHLPSEPEARAPAPRGPGVRVF